jgi:hypothetical protein
MILADVIYRGFESDWEWLSEHPESDFHELDGEMKLLTDAGVFFVSWSQRGSLEGGYQVLTRHESSGRMLP